MVGQQRLRRYPALALLCAKTHDFLRSNLPSRPKIKRGPLCSTQPAIPSQPGQCNRASVFVSTATCCWDPLGRPQCSLIARCLAAEESSVCLGRALRAPALEAKLISQDQRASGNPAPLRRCTRSNRIHRRAISCVTARSNWAKSLLWSNAFSGGLRNHRGADELVPWSRQPQYSHDHEREDPSAPTFPPDRSLASAVRFRGC